MRLYICIDGIFAGTQAEANAKGKGWSQVEVPTDKAGLIDYLNGMVEEARGGIDPGHQPTERDLLPVLDAPKPVAATRAGYAEQSIQLDDDFDRLPIARQLDLAARAMENARGALPGERLPGD